MPPSSYDHQWLMPVKFGCVMSIVAVRFVPGVITPRWCASATGVDVGAGVLGWRLMYAATMGPAYLGALRGSSAPGRTAGSSPRRPCERRLRFARNGRDEI